MVVQEMEFTFTVSVVSEPSGAELRVELNGRRVFTRDAPPASLLPGEIGSIIGTTAAAEWRRQIGHAHPGEG